eukprot:664254-Amphidinium_carterae.1
MQDGAALMFAADELLLDETFAVETKRIRKCKGSPAGNPAVSDTRNDAKLREKVTKDGQESMDEEWKARRSRVSTSYERKTYIFRVSSLSGRSCAVAVYDAVYDDVDNSDITCKAAWSIRTPLRERRNSAQCEIKTQMALAIHLLREAVAVKEHDVVTLRETVCHIVHQLFGHLGAIHARNADS